MILYQIVIFIVTAFAIIHGFRRGFTRQIPSLVGISFGAVCSHIFVAPVASILADGFPGRVGHVEQEAFYSVAACTLIFFLAYAIFTTLTALTGRAMNPRSATILNNIAGAVMNLFKYLLFLSIAYNFILVLNPRGDLLKAGKSDDGNAVELVMLMGSGVLGFESVETLAHKVQVEDARKISYGNITGGNIFIQNSCIILA